MDNDIDMIELDFVVDSSKKKKINKKRKLSSNLSQSKPNQDHGEREILKAKRRIIKPVFEKKLIIVLDTNIIIEHVNNLKIFLSNLDSKENIIFVIPLIVIQELDVLKNKKRNRINNKCLTFINEQLKSKKWVFSDVFLLEKVAEDVNMEHRVDFMQLNNDDRILKKCVILKESFSQDKVILLTDDLNLRNKAIAINLISMNWLTFNQSYKSNLLLNDQHKLIQINQESYFITDWLAIKYDAEKKLNVFIKSILQKIYGPLWEKVFKIDFINCDLIDQIRILKQGWLGTFSDAFERNKNWKNKIDTIFQLLKKEKIDDLKELVVSLTHYIESKNSKETTKKLRLD